MEKLDERRQALHKALKRFEHTLIRFEQKSNSFIEYDELRDSLIQRFEFSVDTFWKYLMICLTNDFKVVIDQVSPKKIFRHAVGVQLMTADEFLVCSAMIDDRNLTSHTYNEKLAQEISDNLRAYFTVLDAIVNRLR